MSTNKRNFVSECEAMAERCLPNDVLYVYSGSSTENKSYAVLMVRDGDRYLSIPPAPSTKCILELLAKDVQQQVAVYRIKEELARNEVSHTETVIVLTMGSMYFT